MKIIFAALFTLTITFSFAQKLEKPTIDPINGDTSVYTKKEVIFNKFSIVLDYLSCKANRISFPGTSKAGYSLVFEIAKGYGTPFSIEKGSKASIKFENGKILELFASINGQALYNHSSGTQIGNSYVSGSSSYSANGWYTITNSDIEQLKANKIAFIRIETTEAPFDYEIKSKNSDVIMNHVKVITH